MKKDLTISEEVLRDIYSKGTKKVKGQIEITFPDLFISKLEKGVWYKKDNALFCWQPEWGVYGFLNGRWNGGNDSWKWNSTEGVSKASFDEVAEALRKEAKKRVYVENGYKPLLTDGGFDERIDRWAVYIDHYDKFTTMYAKSSGKGGDLIFKNGEWAKRKDIARINQVKQQIADLQTELEQLDNYYV